MGKIDYLQELRNYSFTKNNNELRIEYIVGGDIAYNFNFIRILFNFLIYILILIGGLIFCCFGYTYGAEQLHSDNLGMLLIFISIATQIFLFIVLMMYLPVLTRKIFFIIIIKI